MAHPELITVSRPCCTLAEHLILDTGIGLENLYRFHLTLMEVEGFGVNEHTLIVLRVRLYSQGLVIIWGVFGNTERPCKKRGIVSTKYIRWEYGQAEGSTGDPPGEPRSFSLRWVRKQDTFQVKQLKTLRS